jgi:hypothetical protein
VEIALRTVRNNFIRCGNVLLFFFIKEDVALVLLMASFVQLQPCTKLKSDCSRSQFGMLNGMVVARMQTINYSLKSTRPLVITKYNGVE